MTFNKYYQDELTFLRDMGTEFARAYPELAPFLLAEGSDPDVERLLEGFAFLSGRLRQKLDDELPELTHSLTSLLWPHFLRPIPAMSILQFHPVPHLVTGTQVIPRGTQVDSVPVEGTPCRFRTAYDVAVHPLSLAAVDLEQEDTAPTLRLVFECNTGVPLDVLELESIRLYLHGDAFVSQSLYLWLCRYVTSLTVRSLPSQGAGASFTLPPAAIQPVGFAEDEGLLPYAPTAFVGYRLLQEYFALPQKFLFVDITGLTPLRHDTAAERFEILCTFSQAFDNPVRVSTNNVSLYCTPIVNLFEHDADPIRLNHEKVEYLVRPSHRNPSHFDVYTIQQVTGLVQGSGERRQYHPFLSLQQMEAEEGLRQAIYYRARLTPSVIGGGVDTSIAFVTREERPALPPTETISLELICTNRDLPTQLKVGDISVPTASTPESVRFRNIFRVTPAIPPPLDSGLHWHLISNMSLNYISLANIEALRVILSTYNFQMYYDRQATRAHELRLKGLERIQVSPIDRLLRGSPIRGLRIDMDMRESHFAGEGDLYLLATVLNEFFTLYVSINAFHELVVRNVERGEEYRWPTRIGQQQLL